MALSNAYRPEDQLMQKLKNRFATTGRPASRGEVLGAMEGQLSTAYAKARGAAAVNEQSRQFNETMAYNRQRDLEMQKREDEKAKSQGMASFGGALGAVAGAFVGSPGIGAAVGSTLFPMLGGK